MSLLWRLLDRGISAPGAPAHSWRNRILYGCGCWLARKGGAVTIGRAARIHPAAMINSRECQIILGDEITIAPGVAVQGNVTIGNNCSVQMNGVLVGYPGDKGRIRIGNNVRIAANCMMIAGNHVFSDHTLPICKQGLTCAPITIEEDVWIGGRVNIMAGVTIGQGSVIGAGSVVTKDIPPFSVAVGIPARVIKSRKQQTM